MSVESGLRLSASPTRPECCPLAPEDAVFVWRSVCRFVEKLAGGTTQRGVDPEFELAKSAYMKLWGEDDEGFSLRDTFYERCPHCQTSLITDRDLGRDYVSQRDCRVCNFCGFWWAWEDDFNYGNFPQRFEESISVLRSFRLNDAELALNEIGAYIRRNPSAVYRLSPRRFEELVAGIYRELGYAARLTMCSRDGGFDILLEDSRHEQILVECKRYRADHHVPVSVVRQLLGVQLIRGCRRAKLVTSSYFTAPALEAATMANGNGSGFEIELDDVEELMRALGAYKASLPQGSLVRRVLMGRITDTGNARPQ